LSLGINLLPQAINEEIKYKYFGTLVVRVSKILKELRRSMLFGVFFITASLVFLGFVIYFYVLKSPEKQAQLKSEIVPELRFIIPDQPIIPDATSTEYRGFRELLEEDEN
jgi:hypothetical protein